MKPLVLAAAVLLGAMVPPLFVPQVFLWLRGIDRQLSADPVIEQIDEFVSAEECQRLQSIVEQVGGPWMPYDENIGTTAESKHILPFEVDADPLLRELDRRASRWIGLEAADRTGLWIKRHSATAPATGREPTSHLAGGAGYIPANLHVDNHRMPHRLGTVIVYCEPVTNSSGGETVFPCLLDTPRSSAEKFRTSKLRDMRAAQCVAAGSAPPTGRVTAYGPAFDPFRIWKLAVDACRGEVPALKTRPKVGTAVMHRTGVPTSPEPGALVQGAGIDFRLFHTGCPVASNAAKFTVQKFGERPPSVRVAETWDEDVPESTRQLFHQADLDRSGRLNAAELDALHPRVDMSKISEEAATANTIGQALLAETDLDKTGDLDLREFSANGHHWKGAARQRDQQ